MTKTKIKLEWTGYASDDDIREYMDSHNGGVDTHEEWTLEEATEFINSDSDYWQWEWEAFTEYLTELMGDQKYWRDNATNMGWMNRTGFKVFEAKDGTEFLRAISPNTDCHYEITQHGKGFKVRLSHHDAPMGEYHTISPMTEENYNLAS